MMGIAQHRFGSDGIFDPAEGNGALGDAEAHFRNRKISGRHELQ
jgi:hypothetical protein